MNTRQVFKYLVPVTDQFTLLMPEGAEVLSVHVQHEEPRLWALVNPLAPPTQRRFRLADTGQPIHEEFLAFVGTFILNGGDLVFHLFEILEPEAR